MQPYPLQWPKGWPRTTTPQSSPFKTALSTALNNVRKSLTAFGKDSGNPISDIIISSNAALGHDDPKDCAVAVWFVWEGKQLCIAVDKYKKVQDNLQAIHFVIESRRTELRHGGLHLLRQAFAGFKALPAGKAERDCWEVLKMKPTKKEADIHERYRELAKTMHPDTGGSAEAFCELQEAREQAINLSKQ
jgi:DnaJ domain